MRSGFQYKGGNMVAEIIMAIKDYPIVFIGFSITTVGIIITAIGMLKYS